MPKIEIYSKTYCPYCDKAKSLFKSKGASFTEILMDDKPDEMKQLMEKTGMRTVPQIFINDELIGGFSELDALNKEGKLDSLLRP